MKIKTTDFLIFDLTGLNPCLDLRSLYRCNFLISFFESASNVYFFVKIVCIIYKHQKHLKLSCFENKIIAMSSKKISCFENKNFARIPLHKKQTELDIEFHWKIYLTKQNKRKVINNKRLTNQTISQTFPPILSSTI